MSCPLILISKRCKVSSCKTPYYKVPTHRKDVYEYQYCPKHREELHQREAEEIVKRQQDQKLDMILENL